VEPVEGVEADCDELLDNDEIVEEVDLSPEAEEA